MSRLKNNDMSRIVFFKMFNVVCFFFLCHNLMAQKELLKDLEWSIFAGPNISTVVERWSREIPFFASPPRPFYTLNYLGGLGVRKKLKPSLSIGSRIFYEKIADAAWEFNGERSEYNLDFISLGVLGIWSPTASKKAHILFGPSAYFSINKADAILFQLNGRLKWSLSLGTEIQMDERMALQIVFMHGISGYAGKAFNTNLGGSYSLPHSFQFSLSFLLNNK